MNIEPTFILLIIMSLATVVTFSLGMQLNKAFIKSYKYSILTVLFYNVTLLFSQIISHQTLDIAVENAIPVIGLFVFRNLHVEFYKSINKKEDNGAVALFVRVVPYIYTFLMSLSMLQLLANGSDDLLVIDAFNMIVIVGVIVYQIVVLVNFFIINVKLKSASIEKYQGVFMSNLLAVVIYFIVLSMNLIMGSLLENLMISGIIYTIIVGFLFTNHIHEDSLYEAKIFQKKVVDLVVVGKKPEESIAYDSLTGVYTREYFIRHIKTFDVDDNSLSVIIISLTGLKLINGSFGYEYGDEILQEITLIISDIFQDSTIARMSGSQFAITQTSLSETEIIKRIEVVRGVCCDRDNFVVDIHFGYHIKRTSHLLLYEIYKRAEDDLYHNNMMENKVRQDDICSMLYTNFGMLLPTLSGHLVRCGDLAEAFAKYLQYPQNYICDIRNAALLHDISLTFMPYIVEYQVAFKDDFEQRSYRSHTAKGYDIAVESGVNPRTSKGIRYHHENYNGLGYPDGLKGDDIPKIAQIVAIVDLVDMVINYGKRVNELESILKEKINIEFSKELVYTMRDFLKLRGIIE